jgi:hypothetical protein
MRTAIRSLIYGASALILTSVPSYMALWHLRGLNHVSPDDGPLVAVLAIWCLGWSLVIGVLAAVFVVVVSLLRTRRQKHSQLMGG